MSGLFRTHLTTDKPIYKPGDTVYFRAVILDSTTLTPCSARPEPTLKILSPSGEKVIEDALAPVSDDGVVGGEWKVDDEQAGGDYKAEVHFPYNSGFPPATREFQVQRHHAHRLNTQVEFAKKGYGAGDEVIATLEVSRAEVTATARVDGQEVAMQNLKVSEQGTCLFKFTLPSAIERGEGNASFAITDGGIETASKTIPILLSAVDVKVYPEGGELIAGVPCGLYIEAFTPFGDPADISGSVMDMATRTPVAMLHTVHEGRGKTVFTPQAGVQYIYRIDRPSGITKPVELPAAKPEGVSLRATQEVYTINCDKAPITVALASPTAIEARVQLHKGDTLLATEAVELNPRTVTSVVLQPNPLSKVPAPPPPPLTVPGLEGPPLTRDLPEATVKGGKKPRRKKRQMMPGGRGRGRRAMPAAPRQAPPQPMKADPVPELDQSGSESASESESESGSDGPADAPMTEAFAAGVLRVTVTTKHAAPLAERLVFCVPPNHVKIDVTAISSTHCPGGQAEVQVQTRDALTDKPIDACVLVTVTDDSVLEMVEKRRQLPMLPAMALLEDEVQELMDAHTYLEYTSPSALSRESSTNTDLLLGTQGWRRFVFATADRRLAFLEAEEDKAKRVLVCHTGEPQPLELSLDSEEEDGLDFLAPPPMPPMMAPMAAPMMMGGGMAMAPPARGGAPPMMPGAPRGAMPRAARGRGRGAMKGKGGRPVEKHRKKSKAPARKMDKMMEKEEMAKPAMQAQQAPAQRRGRAKRHPKKQPKAAMRAKQAAVLPPPPPPPAKRGIAARVALWEGGGPKADMALIELDGPYVPPSKPKVPTLVWREYAFVPEKKELGERTDFTETLFHNTGSRTTAEGTATFSFGLSDSITSFRVLVHAFTQDGVLGSSKATAIQVKQPFYTEPRVPMEVNGGDRINMSVALVNGTDEDLEGTITQSVAGTGLSLLKDEAVVDQVQTEVVLPAEARTRILAPIQVNDVPFPEAPGDAENGLKGASAKAANKAKAAEKPPSESVTIHGECDPFSDTVTRDLRVVPHGFPRSITSSGKLKSGGSQTIMLKIPESYVSGSVATSVKLVRSPLSSLSEALKALLREPSGCFEQTSSTVYPLVMAQQYFLTHVGVDPAMIEDAGQKLKRGLGKLMGYEVKGGGYEWFGSSPAHESLTAYGLCEFEEMAKVMDVDPKMLERTREWLKSRRDKEGGYMRNRKALDSFGSAPPDTTNAYITWSLIQSGHAEHVVDELKALVAEASKKGVCSYIIALAAGALQHETVLPLYSTLGVDKGKAANFLNVLKTRQQKDGSIHQGKATITRSGGLALTLETTALAMLAWMQAEKYLAELAHARDYVLKNCNNGRFGSTQATILCLKAIIAYDERASQSRADGAVVVKIDDEEVARCDFEGGDTGTLELPSVGDALDQVGQHQLTLEMEGGFDMPFTCAVDFAATEGDTHPDCPVTLDAQLNDTVYTEGQTGEVRVVLENTAEEGQPMTLAIIGLPGGMEPRMKQLKELVKADTISFYEVRGRDVVCYWRCLAPKARVEFSIEVAAAIPGDYSGPASRAYLYYTDEQKYWVPSLTCKIEPKATT